MRGKALDSGEQEGKREKKNKSRNTATGRHNNTTSRRGRKGKEKCERRVRVSKEFIAIKQTVEENLTSVCFNISVNTECVSVSMRFHKHT